MTQSALFDAGLQPERTALAWRRTVLALALGAAVALRILQPVLGVWSIAVGVAGLVSAAVMWILAGRRAHQVTRALLHASGPLPGGGLLFQVALTVTAGGVLGVVFVVLV